VLGEQPDEPLLGELVQPRSAGGQRGAEQAVQPHGAGVLEAELDQQGGPRRRQGRAIDAVGDLRVGPGAGAVEQALIEGVRPGGGPVVVGKAGEERGRQLLGQAAGAHLQVPGGLAVGTLVDEPDVEAALLGVDAKPVAGGERADPAAARAVPHHQGRGQRDDMPDDGDGTERTDDHGGLPFREAPRGDAQDRAGTRVASEARTGRARDAATRPGGAGAMPPDLSAPLRVPPVARKAHGCSNEGRDAEAGYATGMARAL
jgi:hypothetical protein